MGEQAGGHQDAFSFSGDGKIKKKVGAGEIGFYSNLQSKYDFMIGFAPTCFGTEKSDDGSSFVVMEDLTAGMKDPCIMDVKMGTSSAAEDATPEKAAKMRHHDINSTTAEFGVRIVGMKYFDETTGNTVKHDKPWGKALTKDNIQESLLSFFGTEEKRKKLLPPILERL